MSEIWALLSHLFQELRLRAGDLLVILLAVVVKRLIPGGGVLQTLGSPRDPDCTGSSAGSKSVEKCEGMVAVAAEADTEELKAVAVVAEVAEAVVAEADVSEADFS